jgi:uncharacterized protein
LVDNRAVLRMLVLVALVVLAVWLVRRALRAPQDRTGTQGEKQGELVRCAHCGLHLPRAEAREAAGALYCSEEHARLGRR